MSERSKEKAPTDSTLLPITERQQKSRNQLLSEFSVLKVKFEDLSAENETLSSNIDELQIEMTELRQSFQASKCEFEQKLMQMKYEQKKRGFSYRCLATDIIRNFSICVG